MLCDFFTAVYEEQSAGYGMKYDRDGSPSFLVASAMDSVKPRRAGCHFDTGLGSV